VDPRLLNQDVSKAGLNRPLGQVAIAHDLAMASEVFDVRVQLERAETGTRERKQGRSGNRDAAS
jgi:hypothetical protein